MKAAAGQQRADHIGKCKRTDVRASEFLEVIGACRLQFDRQPRGAGAGQLLGVEPRHQADRAASAQNLPRLGDGERAAVTENVAELRETRSGDRRNPPPYEEIYVRIGSAAKFGRDDVRPEKCDGDIERLIPAEVLQDSQDFEFSLPVKAI